MGRTIGGRPVVIVTIHIQVPAETTNQALMDTEYIQETILNEGYEYTITATTEDGG